MMPAGNAPSFFLAGTMQGAKRGNDLRDQNYRDVCAQMIRERYPHATVNNPAELMWKHIRAERAQVRDAHAALAQASEVHEDDIAEPLRALREVFHEMTDLAARCDVCVAYLPGHEPSMGTAAEMVTAYRARRTVVAVTEMRQNLAVLACSNHIVPDLEAFRSWLEANPVTSAHDSDRR